METRTVIGAVAGGFLGVSLGLVAAELFAIRPLPRPTLGVRGERRRRALGQSSLFAAVEPVVRQVAAWMERPCRGLPRARIEAGLVEAGEWLGFSVEEVAAASLLGAVASGGVAWMLGQAAGLGGGLGTVGFAVGLAIPSLRIAEAGRQRAAEATKSLPGAIDLVALCMSAGLDFPGALGFVIGDGDSGSRDLLGEELRVVLRELTVGHTRTEALGALGRRLPCDAVRTFVARVVQAEERGNPLAEVLRTQAQVLRAERGVRAEEAASRASVLLVIPLMLLLACVLLLLFGPFLLEGGLR